MGVNNFNIMSLSKVNLINPKEVCYEDSIDIIHDELHKTRKSFIKIGWYLKHIDENRMYEIEGYKNIVDFSKDKFNLSQPTTNRFIRLCEEFSVGHNSPELDRKYENYSVSQLIEMVSMKPEQIEQVSSEMSVQEIREIKKPTREAIESFYNLFVKNTEYEKNRKELKEYFIKKFGRSGCGGRERGLSYECSRKGISLDNSSEITWSSLVKIINEMFPVTVIEVNVDDNIPGQTSLEKDFPEYMPEEQTSYATSHKEEQENKVMEQEKNTELTIIDGNYREINCENKEDGNKTLNGYKLLAESYEEYLKNNKVESQNKRLIERKIESLKIIASVDEFIRDEMFNTGAFNDICKGYFRKALINCDISKKKCDEILDEFKWLMDTINATDIRNQ